jgi:dTDP-4-dehydrorhamnose 3,5-epimerase
MMYVPHGFAHGYQALTDGAEVIYQSSSQYCPESERRVRFDDPRVGIQWVHERCEVSPKDAATKRLLADFTGIEIQ